MTVDGVAMRTAERLCAVEWGGDFRHSRSRALLLREYLRRAALWAEALGGTDEWPFFDIAARVDPMVRADQAAVERVTRCLPAVVADIKKTCVWAVHWAALRAARPAELPDLDDPFDPLIVLYERGGDFTLENAFIEVDYARIRMLGWRDHLFRQPLVGLDPVSLDLADAG